MAGFAASSEWASGYLVRVHPGGGGPGDPYVASLFAVPDGTTAEVRGLVVRGLSLREFAEATRAVEGHLRGLGFRKMRYERRMPDGKIVWREKDL